MDHQALAGRRYTLAGPYQSDGYAWQQARPLVRDPSEQIWRDHARPANAEQLARVS